MTNEDIKYVLEDILGYNISGKNNPVPLKGVLYFNEGRFIDVDRTRDQFDLDNRMMKIYYCKKTSIKEENIPSSWKEYKDYDVIDGVVYKYLCRNNEPVVDYVDIESLDVIGIDDKEN